MTEVTPTPETVFADPTLAKLVRELARMQNERDAALAELAQWRANHDDQVRRKQAVQAMYEAERAACAEWERQWNDAAEELKGLREALIAMDEAVCHGSPETAKRIARDAVEDK